MPAYFGVKQPWEQYFVRFDFTEYLGATETMTAATVTAVDLVAGTDVSSTLLNSAKQSYGNGQVYAWVQAGATGKEYKITCRVTTTEGSKYELDGILPVRDK